MIIEWIKISGFRNFEDETINFANQTLVIGANDIGKTNLIYALRILFDKSFSDRDLELQDSDYNVFTKSSTIEITVKLTDITEDCLLSIFSGDVKDRNTFIQYKNKKDGDYSILTGHSMETLKNKNSRYYIKRLNMEYVNTNRNLTSFMKRERNQILKDSKSLLSDDQRLIDEQSIATMKEDLVSLNNKVDSLNYIKRSLKHVNKELGNLAIHNLDHELGYKNANSDISSLLDNLQLTYASDGETVTLGGDGRNNQIFLATWVAKQKNKKNLEKVTFFAIEEPEAHLHPHQQRKLSNYLLENFEEQVFITTHSPHIATEFRPDMIVKLYSNNRLTRAAQGGCSRDIQITFDDFGYRLDAITADVFFVNAVLLVEGPSEKLFYTAVSKRLNLDLDRLNVSIISVNGVGFKPYIKICLALGIPYVVRTDNDIFTKTVKVSDTDKEERNFQAGVSRIMGIYEELLKNEDNQGLIDYWSSNKQDNEWIKGSEPTKEAFSLLTTISQSVEDDNIFLSTEDLESDLANSELYTFLARFYNTRTINTTVKKMQTAKAENMLKFLKEYHHELNCLASDKVLKPLLKIVSLGESVVNQNE